MNSHKVGRNDPCPCGNGKATISCRCGRSISIAYNELANFANSFEVFNDEHNEYFVTRVAEKFC